MKWTLQWPDCYLKVKVSVRRGARSHQPSDARRRTVHCPHFAAGSAFDWPDRHQTISELSTCLSGGNVNTTVSLTIDVMIIRVLFIKFVYVIYEHCLMFIVSNKWLTGWLIWTNFLRPVPFEAAGQQGAGGCDLADGSEAERSRRLVPPGLGSGAAELWAKGIVTRKGPRRGHTIADTRYSFNYRLKSWRNHLTFT